MRIGFATGYWKQGPSKGVEKAIRAAERLGFDSIWTSEAYGSDVFTPLAWWGSRTSRVKLGTAIAQLSARTPTATAMAALTLDHLSSGRVILGLGASGPQVVEGWYGQPFPRPLARTREYVSIVRKVLARQEPVTAPGPQLPLPNLGPGTTGLGKPLKSTVHPLRADLPIYLAAEGPKNIALAAEIADGWLPFLFSPKASSEFAGYLAEGFALRDPSLRPAGEFEVAVQVPVIPHPDIEAAADLVRPMLALYIGGMGAKSANFHRNVIDRLGYSEACDRIQDLYLDGNKKEAIAAVPTALVEEIALIGPPEKIRDELAAWEESVVTTMLVQGPALALRTIRDLVTGEGSLRRAKLAAKLFASQLKQQ
ncbi:MAG: LLM class F420-dependent oxidoreductase [Cryobacterium sp.]|nr:LLM class F420-dependent oxidoreductase [Cryobacterium sp.]MBX3088466.1 LLM class F420-dependent oxidoreductase [Cryobacterium sp.]MBX3089656.1 LLM class F420-dependent oxidoreductase [Cryobacterium sp.]MBX3115892.1 LLM class F420-dependent oxidoreductase [Cryobacterium sp.]MCO5294928.1 LLM class F420-dependent oxidoreductase [Homoserinimonas sp.]